MSKNKKELYDKALDLFGLDGLMDRMDEAFLSFSLVLADYKDQSKRENLLPQLIERIALGKIMLDLLIHWLKKYNKDEALWATMHSQFDHFKKTLLDKERKMNSDE